MKDACACTQVGGVNSKLGPEYMSPYTQHVPQPRSMGWVPGVCQTHVASTPRRATAAMEQVVRSCVGEALAARKAKLVGDCTSGAPLSREELCTICLDDPKDHILVPSGHQCVCGA
jgi:hypothetical protein